MWTHSVNSFPAKPALCSRSSVKSAKKKRGRPLYEPLSYSEVEKEVVAFGAGLAAVGLKEEEAVGLISENCWQWMVCDLAIIGNRAFDVPRSVDSTDNEIEYILNHANCRIIIVQDQEELKQIESIYERLPSIEVIIVMSEYFNSDLNKVYSYEDIKRKGTEHQDEFRRRRENSKESDLVTLMYTSGTTGTPKGVPLTHANLMSNIKSLAINLPIDDKVKFLSILPVWHTFERTVEYYGLSAGAGLYYTNRITFLNDMSHVNPDYFVSVPRIWMAIHNRIIRNIKGKGKLDLFEKIYQSSLKVIKRRRQKEKREYIVKEAPKRIKVTLKDHILHLIGDFLFYRKIRARLGNNFYAGVSGGGGLPEYIDDFLEVINILIIEGYGLTETSPILSMRTASHRIPYTAGSLMHNTFAKILDESGAEVPDGDKGILFVRGPQVMSGYYKNPEETAKVFTTDEEGHRWFNTGDLALKNKTGDLTIIGRAKDTIVLVSGENVEPTPIEEALAANDYVDQVMACGQDQEYITALIVPNMELLEEECQKLNIPMKKGEIPNHPNLKQFFKNIINTIISYNTGFKKTDLVQRFIFTKPFEIADNTLTRTLKAKRQNIFARDLDLIRSMYPHFNNMGNIKGASTND